MNCPKCSAPMREREKEEIVIDICPNCRGVFLDAGELEKLTVVEDRFYRSRYRDDDRRYRDDDRRDRDDDDDDGRGGFLSNIFESFGR